MSQLHVCCVELHGTMSPALIRILRKYGSGVWFARLVHRWCLSAGYSPQLPQVLSVKPGVGQINWLCVLSLLPEVMLSNFCLPESFSGFFLLLLFFLFVQVSAWSLS